MSTGTGTGTISSTESFVPTSAVSISNMALGHLGAKPITDIDEESQEARYCKIFWDNTRDEVLREFPWNFADSSALGAAVTVPTIYDDLWDYAYTYPGDCLLVRRVTEDGSDTDLVFKIVLETLVTGEQRRLVLTNAETAAIHYTARIENTTHWDAKFVASMALSLASKLAVPITKNAKIAEFMVLMYRASIPKAKVSDFKENKTDDTSVSPWETDRFGS